MSVNWFVALPLAVYMAAIVVVLGGIDAGDLWAILSGAAGALSAAMAMNAGHRISAR